MGSLAALLTGRLRRMAAARARIGVIWAVAAGFAVIAVVALIVAGSVLLARHVGPMMASLWVAAGAGAAAVVMALVAGAMLRAELRREAEEAQTQRQAISLILAALPVFQSRSTLLVAVALGILAGLVSASDKDDPKA